MRGRKRESSLRLLRMHRLRGRDGRREIEKGEGEAETEHQCRHAQILFFFGKFSNVSALAYLLIESTLGIFEILCINLDLPALMCMCMHVCVCVCVCVYLCASGRSSSCVETGSKVPGQCEGARAQGKWLGDGELEEWDGVVEGGKSAGAGEPAECEAAGAKKQNGSSPPLSEFNVFKSRLSDASLQAYSISGNATSLVLCSSQASTPREVRGFCSSLSREYVSTVFSSAAIQNRGICFFWFVAICFCSYQGSSRCEHNERYQGSMLSLCSAEAVLLA
jgi:hypothetical protein